MKSNQVVHTAGRTVLRAEQTLIWLTKCEERPEVHKVGEGLVQN